MHESMGEVTTQIGADEAQHRRGHGIQAEIRPELLKRDQVSYENGVITSAELNDARLSLLETEWGLMQAKYGRIVAAARTRHAAGL